MKVRLVRQPLWYDLVAHDTVIGQITLLHGAMVEIWLFDADRCASLKQLAQDELALIHELCKRDPPHEGLARMGTEIRSHINSQDARIKHLRDLLEQYRQLANKWY